MCTHAHTHTHTHTHTHKMFGLKCTQTKVLATTLDTGAFINNDTMKSFWFCVVGWAGFVTFICLFIDFVTSRPEERKNRGNLEETHDNRRDETQHQACNLTAMDDKGQP